MDIHKSTMDIHDWNIDFHNLDLFMDHHIYLVDIPKLYIFIIWLMDLHNSIYVSP